MIRGNRQVEWIVELEQAMGYERPIALHVQVMPRRGDRSSRPNRRWR
jgi:hypothetical protein